MPSTLLRRFPGIAVSVLGLALALAVTGCMQHYDYGGGGPAAQRAAQAEKACFTQLRRHLESRNLTAATRGDFRLAMQLCSVRQLAEGKLLLDKQNSYRLARPDNFGRECVPTWNCRCHNHRYEELFARRNMKNHRMPQCNLTPKFPVFDGSGSTQFSRRRS